MLILLPGAINHIDTYTPGIVCIFILTPPQVACNLYAVGLSESVIFVISLQGFIKLRNKSSQCFFLKQHERKSVYLCVSFAFL